MHDNFHNGDYQTRELVEVGTKKRQANGVSIRPAYSISLPLLLLIRTYKRQRNVARFQKTIKAKEAKPESIASFI
jgi:hypothetical protein